MNAGRIILLLVGLGFGSRTFADPFCFIALPDTQRYSENLLPPHPLAIDSRGTYRYFTDQTAWIVEHAKKLNLRHVIHLGDVVQTAHVEEEWKRAKSAMDVLAQAGIPYAVLIGNHDLLGDRGHPYTAYLTYFGPQHFEGKAYFKGSSPQGVSHYQVFEHGKYSFLFLNMGYSTPEEDVAWADEVLRANRDKIVIVSTHAYLWDVGLVAGRYGEDVGFSIMSNRINRSGRVKGAMTSQDFYERFITKHPNILMVQCGHSGLDWYRTDGVNGAGQPVIEVLTNYQALPNGGEGFLRIYEIDPDAGTLSARTFSPTHERERNSVEHFVQMIGLSFGLGDKAEEKGGSGGMVQGVQALLLKRDVVPNVDVVGQHPEFQKDPELYRRLYRESFLGPVPERAGQPEDWEGLWMRAFARDQSQPADYSPNVRSPSFTIPIDLDRYLPAEGDPTTNSNR